MYQLTMQGLVDCRPDALICGTLAPMVMHVDLFMWNAVIPRAND